jgi:hypothetical protein
MVLDVEEVGDLGAVSVVGPVLTDELFSVTSTDRRWDPNSIVTGWRRR